MIYEAGKWAFKGIPQPSNRTFPSVAFVFFGGGKVNDSVGTSAASTGRGARI